MQSSAQKGNLFERSLLLPKKDTHRTKKKLSAIILSSVGMDDEQHIYMRLEGISCSGCVTDMETVLMNTDGIVSATVRYVDDTINIAYSPDEIDRDTLLAKVKTFGFRIEEVD